MLSLFQESLIASPSLSALPSEFSTAPTREQIESGNLFFVSEVKYKLIYPGQPLL
jgi:hypothetical protein